MRQQMAENALAISLIEIARSCDFQAVRIRAFCNMMKHDPG